MFWEWFESILEKVPDLTNSDKLYYLNSAICCKEGQDILVAMSAQGEGYDQAVQQLKRRYDCRRMTYRMHLQQLVGRTFQYNRDDINKAITHVRCHVRGLEVNGPFEASHMVTALVESHMDEDMFREWTLHTSKIKKSALTRCSARLLGRTQHGASC